MPDAAFAGEHDMAKDSMDSVENSNDTDLRRRVEGILKSLERDPKGADAGEVRRIIEDLFMENIELNLQCELLRGAQEELDEARRRYVHLYDFSPIGYFTLDDSGMIIEANLTGSELLGIERKYLINYPFSIYVAPESLDEFRQFRKNIAEYKRRQTCELILQRHDGTLFPAYLESIPIEDAHGYFSQFRTTVQDVSEKKRVEEERKELETRLGQAKKMESIGKLAGGIAHELNNILTGILGWAELLKMQCSSRDTSESESAGHIITLVDRASDVVQKLLGFAGGGKYEPVALEINQSVNESLKLTGLEFVDSISIVRNYARELFKVEADSLQIEHALTNILINAHDAMPGGGTLTVTTQNVYLDRETAGQFPRLHEGYYVRIDVTDSGEGMTEEVMKQIFEPFFTTRPKKKGLGLATVYGIIKSHDGYVECRSEEGKGSTFSIYLPAIGSAREDAHIPPAPGSINSTAIQAPDGKILIVDDDEYLRKSMNRILSVYNFNTVFAEDGSTGIHLYKERMKEIKLVLLDMLMPNLSGKDTFFELKKINPSIKVLLMSGYSESNDVQEAIKAGALGFIRKPFNMARLADKISEALEKE